MRTRSRTHRLASRHMGKLLLLFVGFWSVITLSFDAFMGWNIYRQWQSQHFHATTGTITHSEITREQSTDSDGHTSTTYRPDVAFRYQVDDTHYESDSYRFGAVGSSDRSAARAVVQRFPEGETVEVYYDPADPQQAVLVRGIEGTDLFLITFMLPFNAVMLGGWLGMGRHWLNRGDGPGGLHVRQEVDGQVVRLGRLSALFVPLIVAGLGGFAAIFLVGFTVGINPPVELMQYVLVGIAALAALGFALNLAYNLATPQHLRLDEQREMLQLPLRQHREPIAFGQVLDIEMKAYHGGKEYQGNNGFYIYHPMVRYHDAGGHEQLARLPAMATADRANAFVAWLSEKVGIPQTPSAKRDTVGTTNDAMP